MTAAADTPIAAPGDDLLGIDEYARELARCICRAEPPFTVGVYGEWGSGKTSLVYLAKHYLESENEGKPFRFISFSAWPHKTAEDLWRALVLTIARDLYDMPEEQTLRGPVTSPQAGSSSLASLRDWLQRDLLVLHEDSRAADDPRAEYEQLVARLDGTSYGGVGSRPGQLELKQEESMVAIAKAVTSALGAVSPVIAGIRSLFGLDEKIKVADLLQREKNQATRSRIGSTLEFRNALRDLFAARAADKSVYVFIDDLDRCMPEVALDLLEATKVVLGHVKCIFIVAADQQLIAQGLRARFGDIRLVAPDERAEAVYGKKGREYFEKIIQFGVPVPEPTPELAHRFIAAQFPQWVPVSDLIETAIGTNPRRLKQYCGLLDYRIAIWRNAARELRQRSLPREKLVSVFWYDPTCLQLISAIADRPQGYAQTMKNLEACLCASTEGRPLPDLDVRIPDEDARRVYSRIIASGPLLRLFKLSPPLSDYPAAVVSALARFADVSPEAGGTFTSRDPVFLRVLDRVSRRLSASPEELLQEDLAQMVLVDTRAKDLSSRLIELAEFPEWPKVLTELERRLEAPCRPASGLALPAPAQAILDLVEASPPTSEVADLRPLLLGRTRFSAMCREEVAGFGVVRDRLPAADVVLSKQIYQDAFTDTEKARQLARAAFKELPEEVRGLVECAYQVRAEAATEYLQLRTFAKLDLLAHSWPQVSACLRDRRAALLALEAQVILPESAKEGTRGGLDSFLEDGRLVRFLSLRPYLTDIFPEEVKAYHTAAAGTVVAPSQTAAAIPPLAAAALVPEPEYENIVLAIQPGEDETLQVRLEAGAESEQVSFKLTTEERKQMFEALRVSALGPAAVGRESRMRAVDATITIRDVGHRLFDRVAKGPARKLLLKRLGDATTRTRVMLRVSEGDLSLVPWECLYVRELRAFLGLSEAYSLVRHIPPGRTSLPLLLEPPLRVLAVLANPLDIAPLNLEGEYEMLKVGLEQGIRGGWVQLTVIDPKSATAPRVHESLKSMRPHVFHFAGHGLYRDEFKEGALVLGTHTAEAVSAIDVVTMLESNGVALAVLNGCDTGSSAKNDAITGLAGTLVRRGVPAVVATMREVMDEAGLTFTRNFYSALAEGASLESSVVAARKALSIEKWDWSTYALFTNLEDPERLRFVPPQSQRSSDVRFAGPAALSVAAAAAPAPGSGAASWRR